MGDFDVDGDCEGDCESVGAGESVGVVEGIGDKVAISPVLPSGKGGTFDEGAFDGTKAGVDDGLLEGTLLDTTGAGNEDGAIGEPGDGVPAIFGNVPLIDGESVFADKLDGRDEGLQLV